MRSQVVVKVLVLLNKKENTQVDIFELDDS